MKEAGIIIDLLDKEIIKDLKFYNFTFENTTAGKMLLGISFVLSKQYSDQLLDNVKRGIKHNIDEGKYLTAPKHGYYKDQNKYLRPDDKNFTLIKTAWIMRLQKKTLDEIADFLNQNKYTKAVGTGNTKHKIAKMNKKRLSELFRDTFYSGVLVYGNFVVDLTDLYDFQQTITIEEFLRVNRFDEIAKSIFLRTKASKEGVVKADLMRGMVICGHCGNKMIAGITIKPTRQYFFYRCDTPSCRIKNQQGKLNKQNVRTHVILDFIHDFLHSQLCFQKSLQYASC